MTAMEIEEDNEKAIDDMNRRFRKNCKEHLDVNRSEPRAE